MKKIFCLLPFLLLTACYPVIEKTRPKLQIVVTDSNNQLIDDTYVVLTTTIHEGKSVSYYTPQYAKNGYAYFTSNHTLSLNMGLNRRYFWSICASKQGYKRQYKSYHGEGKLDFKLEKLEDSSILDKKCEDSSLSSYQNLPRPQKNRKTVSSD